MLGYLNFSFLDPRSKFLRTLLIARHSQPALLALKIQNYGLWNKVPKALIKRLSRNLQAEAGSSNMSNDFKVPSRQT